MSMCTRHQQGVVTHAGGCKHKQGGVNILLIPLGYISQRHTDIPPLKTSTPIRFRKDAGLSCGSFLRKGEVFSYRGTSPIRKAQPPGTPLGPQAKAYGRVLERCVF